MNLFKYFIILSLGLFFVQGEIIAQERITERGTSTFRKVGVHRGNQVRTVFSNFGVIAQPGNEGPRGAWKFDANGYVGDVSPLVGVRLPIRDYINASSDTLDGIPDTIVSVIITPVDRPGGGESGLGKAWGFEPIPGFADPLLDELGKGVAMSHLPETWPPSWPDHPDWTYSGETIIKDGVDITPQVDWNGFFGRAQFNSDQESYFWMDDNNDEEWFDRHGFLPDSMDLNRRGAALQVNVRGLQWSNFLAQNVIFWLYNILNDGTETYDQVVFGTLVGTYVGVETPEWNDDASFFDVRDAITYTWDFDQFISPSANPQWLPDPSAVGYIFYAFLESPGNPFDGIDNDGDNEDVTISAPFFQETDFFARTIAPGEKVILIDRDTFERTEFFIPNDTITIYSMGVPFFIEPGVTELVEGNIDFSTGSVFPNASDGIDNDLDGLIDENFQVNYRQFKKSGETVLIDTLNPVQYKDLITNIGLMDPMIDDVGQDGKPNTNDFGEGDGMPTTGEPNFDQTDVDESDQLGLTSFQYFVPAGDITMSDDINMWSRMKPGFYDVPSSVVGNVAIRGEDGDFIFGSGYFPLLPGKTQRFSLALGFGEDFNGAIKTKRIAQIIFNANYNFPRPPEKPTITAVPGDGKVTLYWDRIAENSIDPTLRVKDFEGYKVYKGTDPDFTDALQISDADGTKVLWTPEFQVDLDNGLQGLFIPSAELYEITNGVPYNLGTDSGIQNFFVDNDVINGRTYYYAVVAYDRGDASKDIFPSENSKFISKDALGRITTDINTAALVPNPPVAGYVAPPTGEELSRNAGSSTSTVFFEVMDPFQIEDSSYIVEFNDSLVDGINIAYSYNVINQNSGNLILNDAQMSPDNGDIFNGVRLSIDTSYQNINNIKLNRSLSGWNVEDSKNLNFSIDQFVFPPLVATRYPRDYIFIFSDEYNDSSNFLENIFGEFAPPVNPNINYKIYDITNIDSPIRVQFALRELSDFRKDTLSFDDVIILSDSSGNDFSWRIVFQGDSSSIIPRAGDSLLVSVFKPLSSADEFQFTTMKSAYSVNDAREQLNKITVVPNPYVVTNLFEQPLPPTVRGRGERVIYFMNLPPASTIRIFSSSGDLIRTLQHDGNLENGSVQWDVRTEEGLDVAYGVYFYVVEVEGLSDKKMGKIGIIK